MGPFFVGEIVWMSLQRPAFCLKVAAYGMLMGHKPSSRPLLMKSIGPLVNRRRFAASVLMGGLSLPLAAEVQSEIARESFTQGSSPPIHCCGQSPGRTHPQNLARYVTRPITWQRFVWNWR